MFKLIATTALVSLLAACSGMSTDSMAGSDGMSRTSTMGSGNMGNMQNGIDTRNTSGPN